MKHRRISWRSIQLLSVGLVAALLLPALAQAVTIDLGTASGTVGETVELPVELISLGGETVWSYELDISWSASYAQCVGITTVGTLSENWVVSHAPSSGTVTVSSAGAVPLAGDGTLLNLQFLLGPSAGGITVYLNSVVMNEGNPVPTLVNGLLSIAAVPTVNIYPDSGLLAVGDSLSFLTSGGTPPYTYSSSDPLIADFAGDEWLHALAPGQVRAHTVDANLITDTTTGWIEVRAFRLRCGILAAAEGDTVDVPVEIDDPTGYGIVSAEFQLSWYEPYAEFVGAVTVGTLLESSGWGAPIALSSGGQVSVAAAGVNPLPGPGVLLYLRFVVMNSITLTTSPGIFNEIYPAFPVNGSVSVTPLPSLGVTPATASILVGDTQPFSVTGTPTPPLSWSVDDPLLASINSGGVLTALAEGTVRVKVQDSLGAEAESGVISICSLGLPALASSIAAPDTILVPVKVDRSVTGLNIYSLEIGVSFSPASVEFLGVETSGSMISSWGSPMAIDRGGLVEIYHAGATPLKNCGPNLLYLKFRGLGAPYTGVSLASALFNEGAPCVKINAGTACSPGLAVPALPTQSRLWPSHPNPFNPSTTIRFRLERGGHVKLSLYTTRGERIRRLVDGPLPANQIHEVGWNGRDDDGRLVGSGVYFCRLETDGQTLMRKMTLLK